MIPDPAKTVSLGPGHSIEIGKSSFDSAHFLLLIRFNKNGKYSPRGSSEILLGDLKSIMEVAAQNDILDHYLFTSIIEALAKSIQRQLP